MPGTSTGVGTAAIAIFVGGTHVYRMRRGAVQIFTGETVEALQILSLALGAAWASGVNIYAVVLFLGGLGALGVIDLPGGLDVLSNPAVLITAGIIYVVEFFADKIPGVDSLWDAIHTFIRIPAGALLAAGAVMDIGEPYQVAAALLLGGAVAAGSHATKAGARAAINTSPEPFTNWAASIAEDVLVVGGLSLALFSPLVFFGFFLLFIVFAIWLLPKLWRILRGLIARLGGRASSERMPASAKTRGFKLSLIRPDDRRDPE
jgi:hypothetical protein